MDEPNLTLQMRSAKYVNSICKWMMFFGIVMIISVAAMLLGGIASIVTGTIIGNVDPNLADLVPGVSIMVGIIYIVCAIVCVFPTIFLLRAAKAGKAAVALHDNSKMAEFARQTKSYWKFNGIFTIVALALVVLCMLVAVVAGVAVASTML